MAGGAQRTFNTSTPAVGRGRGSFNIDVTAGRRPVLAFDEPLELGNVIDMPALEFRFSTPFTENNSTVQHLRVLISQ